MRLLITAVVGGAPYDVAADAEDDATVGDLASALGRAFPGSAGTPDGPPVLRVVSDGPQPAGAPPSLFVGHAGLPASEKLATSALRHGSVVGVGAPVPDPLAEPGGLFEVRVTSGAGAGRVTRLDPGHYTVGTGPECDVVVDDPALPALCARLLVYAAGSVRLEPEATLVGATRPAPMRSRPLEGPIVLGTRELTRKDPEHGGSDLFDGTLTVDPADAVPVLHLERTPVEDATAWEPGQTLAVGTVLLDLVRTAAPDASMSASPSGATLDYNRPPRLLPPSRRTSFTLPSEPRKPDKVPVPLLMIIAPILMGGAMFAYTRNPFSLMFMALSPVMALGNYSTGRRQNRKRYVRELTEYSRRTARIQGEALDALAQERAARREDFADPAEVLMTAIGPRARLWERRQTDPDFLLARLGSADQPSDVTVTGPQRESHEGPLAWTVPDVPVTVPLAEVGVTGIAGPAGERLALARWVIGQTAVLHSPADIDMVLLTDTGAADEWGWVRWLPHLRSDTGDSELAHIGVDDASTATRIGELLALLQERVAAARDGQGRAAPFPPVLVILDGARRLRLLPGVPALLQDGPRRPHLLPLPGLRPAAAARGVPGRRQRRAGRRLGPRDRPGDRGGGAPRPRRHLLGRAGGPGPGARQGRQRPGGGRLDPRLLAPAQRHPPGPADPRERPAPLGVRGPHHHRGDR